MQSIKKAVGRCFMGGLFAFGILLAGADFDGFPLLNLAGVFMLGLVALIANRLSPPQ